MRERDTAREDGCGREGEEDERERGKDTGAEVSHAIYTHTFTNVYYLYTRVGCNSN